MSQPNAWAAEEEDLPDIENSANHPTETESSDTQPLFDILSVILNSFLSVVSQATEQPTETTTEQQGPISQLPPVSSFCF